MSGCTIPAADVEESILMEIQGMNFGKKWEQFMGECSKDTAFGMMDYFFENGMWDIFSSKDDTDNCIQAATSLTHPTTIKARNQRNGSASGWPPAKTENKWSSQQNTQQPTRIQPKRTHQNGWSTTKANTANPSRCLWKLH